MCLRHLSVLCLAGFLVLIPACDEDAAAPPPPVSFIQVTPTDTVLVPGDSALVRGQPRGVDEQPLDRPLTFRVEDPAVGTVEVRDSTVFRSAVFTALAEGDTRIVVREEGGVAAFVPVRVRRVTGFSPAFTAFGGTVTVRGKGFGPGSRVFFGFPAGVTRSVNEDGTELRAWVPWDAENEPLRVLLDDGSEVRTEEPFVLTGSNDDALEPNGFSMATPVELPFRNPFLRTLIVSMDNFSFILDRPTPVTVRVTDEQEPNTWSFRSVLQVNRVDALGEFYGVSPVYSFGRNERQDGVVSHPSLPAGRYAARIFVAPGFDVIDRRFSIEIDTTVTYALEPDEFEPNALPTEATLLELPLLDTLALENPWTKDYYRIQVTERSEVRISVVTHGRSKGVFFYGDEELRSVQWHLADPGPFPRTWIGRITLLSPIQIACTVEPGEYVLGVLENEGVESPYGLFVDAVPTDSDFFNCQQPGFAPTHAEGDDRLRAEALAIPR